jgi:uncharacterized protein YegP (UPF0339 family)
MAMPFKQMFASLVVASVAVMLTISAAPAQDKKAKDKAKDVGKASVVFELYTAKDGDFRFRIKDSDGDILAITQKGYEKKEDILKVIDTIKKGAATAKLDDLSTPKK